MFLTSMWRGVSLIIISSDTDTGPVVFFTHPEQRGTRGTIFICTKIIQCLFYPCFLGRGPIISCIFYLYIFKFLCLSPHNVWQPCLEQTCVFVQKSNKHAGNNIYTHFLRPDMFHCFGTHSPSFFKYTQE